MTNGTYEQKALWIRPLFYSRDNRQTATSFNLFVITTGPLQDAGIMTWKSSCVFCLLHCKRPVSAYTWFLFTSVYMHRQQFRPLYGSSLWQRFVSDGHKRRQLLPYIVGLADAFICEIRELIFRSCSYPENSSQVVPPSELHGQNS